MKLRIAKVHLKTLNRIISTTFTCMPNGHIFHPFLKYNNYRIYSIQFVLVRILQRSNDLQCNRCERDLLQPWRNPNVCDLRTRLELCCLLLLLGGHPLPKPKLWGLWHLQGLNEWRPTATPCLVKLGFMGSETLPWPWLLLYGWTTPTMLLPSPLLGKKMAKKEMFMVAILYW